MKIGSNKSRMILLLLAWSVFSVACSESGRCAGVSCGADGSPPFLTLRFSMVGDTTGAQDFIATTNDVQIYELAGEEMRLPLAERTLFITGPIDRDNGEFPSNPGWNWHFLTDEWSLTDAADVLCDGNAVIVEQAVDYWVDTVGQFCPADARIVQISLRFN